MELDVLEYLEYPYGKGSAIGNTKETKTKYIESYKNRKSKIKHSIYKFRSSVIYHILIPSENNSDSIYDIVLEFDTRNLNNNSISILDSPVKVFSNVPAFIYTYVNVFYTNKLLCKWLLDKYSKETVKSISEVRNRYQMVGPERYLYMAMMYIKDTGIERLEVIDTTGTVVYTYSYISRFIKSEQEILLKRKVTHSEKLKNEKEISKVLKEKSAIKPKLDNRDKKKNTKAVAKTGKLNTISKLKKTKKI